LLELESSCKPPLNIATLKVHVDVLFDRSLAVQVTEVTPTGKLEPLGGEQVVVTLEQVSETTGAA
jgi:hypothetical protein